MMDEEKDEAEYIGMPRRNNFGDIHMPDECEEI